MKSRLAWLYLVISSLLIYLPLLVFAIVFHQFWLGFGLLTMFAASQAIFFSKRKENYQTAWVAVASPMAAFMLLALYELSTSCEFEVRPGCTSGGLGTLTFSGIPVLIFSVTSIVVQYALFSKSDGKK
jgi:hypothetical protein